MRRESRQVFPKYSYAMSRIGPCDVTSKSDLEKMIKDLSSREKYLNLLVTNAGVSVALFLSSCNPHLGTDIRSEGAPRHRLCSRPTFQGLERRILLRLAIRLQHQCNLRLLQHIGLSSLAPSLHFPFRPICPALTICYRNLKHERHHARLPRPLRLQRCQRRHRPPVQAHERRV